VACPYFYPTERLEQKLWPHPARLPLGGGFFGVCRARPGEEFRPGEAALRDWCSLGYARTECGRFPSGSGPDAVRFAVAGDDGAVVRIQYVVEQGHLPLEHGLLEFDRSRAAYRRPPCEAVLARQAQVYAENYVHRRYGSHAQDRKGIAV
jgi:hypothetical protein